MKLTIMKAMLLPSVLIVLGTAPCWAVAEAAPPADPTMASSQPVPSIVAKPEGLTISEYLQKRLESQSQSQVHQRHTLLTPRELASDFLNWSKDSGKSSSVTQKTLQASVIAKDEIPSTTIAPAPPTHKKPLSHALYSSSLDAMAMNKVAQTSSSRNVFSRTRYTDTPVHLGPDSNKWTPVTSSGAVTTSRNRGGAHRKEDFSFEGGGGGLDPRLMDKKPAYKHTDSFRQKDASAEPGEDTKKRLQLTITLNPYSSYSKGNKQNRNLDPYDRNSEGIASREEILGLSPLFKSGGHTGPQATTEFRWPNGSLINDKTVSKFIQNPTPTFKVDGSSDSIWHESSEQQNDDHNNYSFLGSPEVVGYYRNKEHYGIKTHKPSQKIQYSFEVEPPFSRNNEDTKSMDKSKETTLQSLERKFRDENTNHSEGKSKEYGPYRYKTRYAEKSRETEKHRTTATESPHHSYDKNSNSDEETTKFVENKNYETPIYRSKTNKQTNRYNFRLRPKSSETNKRTTTEKYSFEPSLTDSNERHLSSKSHTDGSEGSHKLEERRFPFDGYITEDHFPKGHKSPSRGSARDKETSKSTEREFRSSHRYESQEIYTEKEPSKERPTQKSRPRSKWNKTDNWTREPSSRVKETTTPSKGPKDRSQGANDWSREASKHSRASSKPYKVPPSHQSNERKTTIEIVDDYAVHHIAGPPYHDSIPDDVVKTLEKEGGPSYIPKTDITHQDKDSYEVAVDKFLDDDDAFNFEEHRFNDPPIGYYEQDAHLARQSSTELSLENATPGIIDIKTSSHFGDVIYDTPTITRRKPSKAGEDRSRVFDELVYEYDGKHSSQDDHHQNHRYDPERVIGSNDPFDFGKNIGRAISYFEQRDPFSERDSVKRIPHNRGREERLEGMSPEDHFERITRHELFGHQDDIGGVFHDSGRLQHKPFSQEDHMEGDQRLHQSDSNQHDPFHYEGHTDDIARHEPVRPRNNTGSRLQVLDPIDENTPPNFFKSSRRNPMDRNNGSAMVKRNFHSLPVDEGPALWLQPSYDISREPRFQVSYERYPPEQSLSSRRRLPTTAPQLQRPGDHRMKPDFDLNRNLRDEQRYRKVPPNRSKDPAPHSRRQRNKGRSRDRILGNGPRDRNPFNGPRDRIPSSGPRVRRTRARSRDEMRVQEKDDRSQGPKEKQWNFQDIVSRGFPNSIGKLFG